MAQEIKIPSIGESVTSATLATWHKKSGDIVKEGEILCDIESDKATVELPSPASGELKTSVTEGTELPIGAVIGSIDTSKAGSAGTAKPAAPVTSSAPVAASSAPATSKHVDHASPAAAKILSEKGVDPSNVSGTGRDGRITKEDAMNANSAPQPKVATTTASAPSFAAQYGQREIRREKMSRLRKTIATRLVEAKNTTAMLTTFNEVDMKAVMDIRNQHKDSFLKKHGVKLGMMSFFTKAVCIALKKYPLVNAQIQGEETVMFDYADIGVAVSTEKGLVVPVLRNAENMSLAQIEIEILRLAGKARDGKLTVDEMTGGTFTITNGGVFGSMLSTPILNIPQSGILGMHNIVERAWVVDGKIEIRPIMYVALSYDHRIIDGRDSVGFLKTVKELLEDPSRMLLDV